MALPSSDTNKVFQPPKKRRRLESVVPPVQAKLAGTAMVPPPTASWLTGALSEPKLGSRGQGVLWNRGRGSSRGGS